jgi:type IV pilus assembly protein PilW
MNYRAKRQAGLTLVELMVATTLSLVLLAGVLLVFSANKTTYQMQNGLGTLQENGRYAMRQITADLQMAGFSGCLSSHINPRVIVLANSPPTYIRDLAIGEFFAGQDNGGASYDGRPMAPGTDAIEIRGPLRSDVHFVAGEASAASDITLTEPLSSAAATPYLVISDCGGADIFAATNDLASGNATIEHSGSGNSQAGFSRAFGADSVVVEVVSHTYFVADTGRDNTSGQDIFALYRFDGTSAQELVDGVENLQIEYALDVGNDGVIDAFTDVVGTANSSQVMAVRISLLLNSVDGASAVSAPYTFFPSSSVQIDPADTDPNDRRLRQEFTALVSVRNSVL